MHVYIELQLESVECRPHDAYARAYAASASRTGCPAGGIDVLLSLGDAGMGSTETRVIPSAVRACTRKRKELYKCHGKRDMNVRK